MAEGKMYYTISELAKIGFSKYELQCATRIEGQTFATRQRSGRGATWRFNLNEYIEFRKRQIAG
ncbi:MAG: hypothetical protein MR966_05285 [Lachnospiraceae bacterium]|nr:hypothetical protein [Lachnospiraceae bacterium]